MSDMLAAGIPRRIVPQIRSRGGGLHRHAAPPTAATAPSGGDDATTSEEDVVWQGSPCIDGEDATIGHSPGAHTAAALAAPVAAATAAVAGGRATQQPVLKRRAALFPSRPAANNEDAVRSSSSDEEDGATQATHVSDSNASDDSDFANAPKVCACCQTSMSLFKLYNCYDRCGGACQEI
jgi:hypothetical protein